MLGRTVIKREVMGCQESLKKNHLIYEKFCDFFFLRSYLKPPFNTESRSMAGMTEEVRET